VKAAGDSARARERIIGNKEKRVEGRGPCGPPKERSRVRANRERRRVEMLEMLEENQGVKEE